jgi:hypothetical protein
MKSSGGILALRTTTNARWIARLSLRLVHFILIAEYMKRSCEFSFPIPKFTGTINYKSPNKRTHRVNITLTLEPEVEKGLLARAHERGLTLDAYLKDLLQKESAITAITRRSGKDKAQAFVAWTKSHRPTKLLSDEAISRTTLYPDRA